MTVSGKSDEGPVTTGSGRTTPAPVSVMTSGPLVASEAIVSVAGRAPTTLGVKVMFRVQLLPARTGAAQPVTA
jgi:hypothetical protein